MRLDRWSSKTELGLQINSLSEVLRQFVRLPFFLSINGNNRNMIYLLLLLFASAFTFIFVRVFTRFDKYKYLFKTRFIKMRLKNAQAKTADNQLIAGSECYKLIDSLLAFGVEYVEINPPKALLTLYKGANMLGGITAIKNSLCNAKYDEKSFRLIIENVPLDYMECILSDYLYKYCLLDEILIAVDYLNKNDFEFNVLCAFKRLIKLSKLLTLNIAFEKPVSAKKWLEDNNYDYKRGAYIVATEIYKIRYNELQLKRKHADSIVFGTSDLFKINSATSLSINTPNGEILCEDVVSDGAVEYPFFIESADYKNEFGKKTLARLSNSMDISYDLKTDKELLVKVIFPYYENINFNRNSILFKKSKLSMILKNSEVVYVERVDNSVEIFLNVTQGGYYLIYGTKALFEISSAQKELLSMCQAEKNYSLSTMTDSNVRYRKKYFDADGNLCAINYPSRFELTFEFENKPIYYKSVMFYDRIETYYQFGNYSIVISSDYSKTKYDIFSDAIDTKYVFIKSENGEFVVNKNIIYYEKCGERKCINVYGTDKVALKNGIITAVIKNRLGVNLGATDNDVYMLPKTIELNSPDLALNLILRQPIKFQIIGISAYDTTAKDVSLDAFITMLSAHIYICPNIVMRAINEMFEVSFTIDKGLYFFNLVFDYIKATQNDDCLCNADNSCKIENFLLNAYQYVISGKEKYAILFLTCVSEFIPYATSESKIKLIDYMENVKRKYSLNYKEVCELKDAYPIVYYSDSDNGVIRDIIKIHEYSKTKKDVGELLDKLNPIKNYVFGRSSNPYSFSNDGNVYDAVCASLFYRVFLLDVLGIKHDKGKFRIEPNLPKSWDYCNAVFYYENSEYHICFIKGDKKSVLCDGVISANDTISLIEDDAKYVEVYYD